MALSLRRKAGLGLLILGLAGILALVAFHRFVISEQFDRVEHAEIERDARRAANAIDVETTRLDLLLYDWSSWDDTYRFMDGPGSAFDAYVESNLVDDILESLQLGALIYIDRAGDSYFETWRWPSGDMAPIQGLEAESPLVTELVRGAQRFDKTCGVILLPNGQPMLVSARPILTSDDDGPAHGTLIMARWLDDDFIGALSESLATPIRFEPLASEPDIVERASEQLAIAVTENGELNGQALVRDINGEPAFLIETNQRRGINSLRNQVLWLGVAAIVATLGVTGVMVYFGANVLLLRPMLRLRGELAELGADEEHQRVTVRGRDEIAEVAGAVNAMLNRLAESAAEQERLTIAASEQEEVARTALLEMGEGFLAFDASGNCLISNPAAGRMLQKSPDEILGRHITQILPAARPSETGDGPQVIEIGGRSLAITRSASLNRGRGGRSVVVLRDVTDILDVERLKRDIISTVSHELRTPLTSIRATVELFQDGDGGALTDVQSRMVSLLSRNTDRLLHIVNDLLALTTLESGAVALRREETDLSVTIARVVEDLQPSAVAAGVTLETDGNAEPAVAWCDEPRIRHVIENLVQNAIKFSLPDGEVYVSARAGAHEVTVTVTDQGLGIMPADQQRVFEKFYRAPGSERVGGTGLGLPIAKLIVDLHGGRIWIESDGASGTTARFTVPSPPGFA
ncbi:MAG: HAMP domain-containing protein [Dehalococcoidia bacterium]|nr:HAMP domain-containing protein [Dehalococcoidia bacterium]MCB9491148.1 HAMP domain-containing protein [Dehalococcoidia bacterium]